MTQSRLLDECDKLLKSHMRALDEVLMPLTAEKQTWRPKEDEYNILQIGDHLLISGNAYQPGIVAGMRGAEKTSSADMPWKPTFMGKQIASKAGPNGNVPMPKSMKPRANPPEGTLEELYAHLERVLTQIEMSRELNINRIKVPIPMLPFIKLNLGDVFWIEAQHVERHIRQMKLRAR